MKSLSVPLGKISKNAKLAEMYQVFVKFLYLTKSKKLYKNNFLLVTGTYVVL
jgi:hypothetical protein